MVCLYGLNLFKSLTFNRFNTYLAIYADTFISINLGFSKNGNIKVKLPQGPKYDNNQLYLHVRVVDNDNGAQVYYLPNAITVLPERQYINMLIESFIQDNPFSIFNQEMSIGLFQKSLQNVLFISSYLNEEFEENRIPYLQNSKINIFVNEI
jgi:hypothetical protein